MTRTEARRASTTPIDARFVKKFAKKKGEPGFDVTTLPKYCDFSCKFASFAPEDAVGACRREQAVYCKLLREFNNKNAPCAARE